MKKVGFQKKERRKEGMKRKEKKTKVMKRAKGTQKYKLGCNF
jgi:hypothetical protein